MQNSTVLRRTRLNISSGGKVLASSHFYCMLTLSLSWARSADALKELNRLIPGFQKKIDEAEPDDAQEFYSIVSTKTMVYDKARLSISLAPRWCKECPRR